MAKDQMFNRSVPNRKVSTERFVEALAEGRRLVSVGPTHRQLAARLKIDAKAVQERIKRLTTRGIVRPVFQGYALTDAFAKMLPENFDKMDKARQKHFIAKALAEFVA